MLLFSDATATSVQKPAVDGVLSIVSSSPAIDLVDTRCSADWRVRTQWQMRSVGLCAQQPSRQPLELPLAPIDTKLQLNTPHRVTNVPVSDMIAILAQE